MIGKIKIDKGIIIIIFLMFFLLLLLYGNVFLHPNSNLFSSTGDGLKNYYTYSYYISNNHSWTNFEGMNFPYGEHFFYTDCTPALAVFIKLIAEFIPSIVNYQIGIINITIFGSFFLSSIFLYLIFKGLKVQFWFAILAALAFTFLCPQIFRMTGHLALSINCFLPISIYVLMRFEKSLKSIKNYSYLSIMLFFWLFIHAYLGVISFFLLFSYFSIKFIFQKQLNLSFKFKKYLISLFSLLIPLILFNVFIFLTDIHTGRTDNPYGFFSFYVELKSLFFPTHGRINRLLYEFTSFENRNWESLNYVGIVSIIVLISLIFNSIYKSIWLKKWVIFPSFFENTFLKILFLASIVVLIFSMCIPFRFHLEFLVNYIKILKQFRALGRFGWAFYFVMSIVSVYCIDLLLLKIKAKGNQILFTSLTILIPVFVFYESIEYHEETFSKIDGQKNLFLKSSLNSNLEDALKTIDSEKYQSIIPFPYYYFGSDNFALYPQNKEIYSISKLLSYHTKLPLMSSFLTRTSIKESENLVQLFSSPFYKKQIKKDINLKKPVLLIVTDYSQLSNNQKEIVKKSTKLKSYSDFSIYSLNTNKLFEVSNQNELFEYEKNKAKLYLSDDFYHSGKNKQFQFFTFDQYQSDYIKRGKGAKQINSKGFVELLDLESKKLKENTEYTIRFWTFHGGKKNGQDKLRYSVFVQTTKDKQIKWISDVVSPINSSEINEEWSLVELHFKTDQLDKKYQLILNGDLEAESNFYIDDLLIYESDDIIYQKYTWKGKKYLFKNNHQILLN